MHRLQKYLFIFFVLSLVYLLYFINFGEKQVEAPKEDMDSLTECITTGNCTKEACEKLSFDCKELANPTITKPKPVIKYTGEDLRKTIQEQIEKNSKAFQQAYKKHWEKPLQSPLRHLNTKFIDYGFGYIFNNVYLYVTLIALGLALGALGFTKSSQIFMYFVIAAFLSSAITSSTIIDNYNYLGPYLLFFGGISVALYNEQKPYAMPVLAALIGVVFGFMVASDSPEHGKWTFILGATLGAGFLTLVSSVCASLFNEEWLDNLMGLMAGALIVAALVLFAMEAQSYKGDIMDTALSYLKPDQ